MQIMSLSVPIAPQTTGHPFGLPENRDTVRRETRIEPIAEARNPEAGFKDGKKPLQFWRSTNGSVDPQTHIAPPSIMQIKISQMLNEQAEPLKNEDQAEPDDKDAAEPTATAVQRGDEKASPAVRAEPRTAANDPREGYAKATQIAAADPRPDSD